MTLKIELTLDNAAFQEYGPQEIARILNNLANHFHDQDHVSISTGEVPLTDINGNRVGSHQITPV